MQAKIEWYKEILELDPSSKVFFPLARLLAEAGQVQDALDFLREGVARHPDCLEARIYCLELSARLGEDEAVAEEASVLGEILGRYPLFWKAWAQTLARKPETRDAALAMDFISVHFKGAPVSWGEVIQRGLEGLFHTHQTSLPYTTETGEFLQRPHAPPYLQEPAAPKASEALADLVDSADLAGHAEDDIVVREATASLAEANREPVTAHEPEPGTAPTAAPPASPRGADDVYSIRTRTMARLLAEQGEYDSALEIYRELLTKAADDDEREELDAIIERMQLMLRDPSRGGAATALPESVVTPDRLPETPSESKQKGAEGADVSAAVSAEPDAAVAPVLDQAPALIQTPETAPQAMPRNGGRHRPQKSPRSALERLALRLERRAAG
ncbi:MAG: hypothetical protein LDL30_02255 [Desulfovibrio sp.]|nr:hypothetical protein [Desulfovibrio sp.]